MYDPLRGSYRIVIFSTVKLGKAFRPNCATHMRAERVGGPFDNGPPR